MTAPGGDVERGQAVEVVRIDVRAVFEEQAHDFLLLHRDGAVQKAQRIDPAEHHGGRAGRGDWWPGVDSGGEQDLDRSEVRPANRQFERGQAYSVGQGESRRGPEQRPQFFGPVQRDQVDLVFAGARCAEAGGESVRPIGDRVVEGGEAVAVGRVDVRLGGED